MEFIPGTTADDFHALAQPTMIIRSDHTIPQMATWADELAAAIPTATAIEVPGSWHGVDDTTLTTTLTSFLN